MKNGAPFFKRPLSFLAVGAVALATLTSSSTEATPLEPEEPTIAHAFSFDTEREKENISAEPVIVDNDEEPSFTDSPSIKSDSFDPEVVEDNADLSWEELPAAQEEFDAEQERIEEEKEAERQAEEAAEERERLEQEAEEERQAEEEAEEEREAQERAEQEEADQQREETDDSSSDSSSDEQRSDSESDSESEDSDSSESTDASVSVSSSEYSNTPTGGGCGGWGDLIREHFGDAQYDKACSVMLCESEGDPQAQNPVSTASGLFQFLDTTWTSARGDVSDGSSYSRAMEAPAEMQIEAAAKWQSKTSWTQWVCQ